MAGETDCETCGGDGCHIELAFRNGRDVEIEHPCPACSADDADDRDPDDRNLREVAAELTDDRLMLAEMS